MARVRLLNRLAMLWVCLGLFVFGLAERSVGAEKKPNILFIAVDDLRPQIGCYGVKDIHTPNLDRLAARGTVFEKAYCMVPTCGASRASLMTGIRPSPKRFVNYLAEAQKDAPGVMTLNTHFKNNGYHTVSNGKIFHNPSDNAAGWSEPTWRPKGESYLLKENQELHNKRSKEIGRKGRGPAYESADVPDNAYKDGKLAEKTIKDLQRLAKQDKPFFLATGFFKPHLPFIAPKKYWDLYDREQIHLPENYHPPKDAPKESLHSSGELRSYAGIPRKGPVSDEMALNLIHGYYACVSYTDALIGQVLDELDRLELTDNTIVILWGDHGWNLGEHTLWCKHSCYETSMHAPLIVAAPGIAGGKKTPGLTEFIDIYPSLCELAGIEQPSHLQGESFVPLMQDPNKEWKKTAVGRYRAGDTIRTPGFRFTEYRDGQGKLQSRMLYNHKQDPSEDKNVAEGEAYEKLVNSLAESLNKKKGKDSKKQSK